MGVETEALKSGPGLVKAQEFDNLGACEAACGGGRFGLVIIYHIVEVSAVLGGQKKRQAATETGLPCSKLVSAMVVDSPQTQFF